MLGHCSWCYRSPDVGAGKCTQVLCKSNDCLNTEPAFFPAHVSSFVKETKVM